MTIILSFLKSFWPYIAALILGSIIVGAIDHHGYVRGEQHIQKQWDKMNQETQKKTADLQSQINAKSVENIRIQRENEDAISKAQTSMQASIDSERAVYAQRLRTSEARAAIYRREAEAGSSQCLNLAGHTTDLDASLEQGRDLVQQLRATLGQRDQTVKALGAILMSDRKAVNSESKDGN